ncbi:expressed unknown protein [Seminavis robusta]|uniref:Uncharacterized protein n=1 Tax=Seminavis robusta TaxID=568900 RepID=A0A9N8EPY3_9STRA|nr:expressed unknown protein [Seminavis robusta]|eukprot:Sro1316_g262160.1 n/a (206) ;mRNA; r:24826-25443
MSGSSTCNQESDSKLKKRPPGLMNFPLMKKNNLLDRVGAFLPQIQAANQELLDATANGDDDNDDAGIRVDLNLEQANDDDDDDDDKESECDKSEAKEDEFLIREHQPGKSSKAIQKEETTPSIQLEFSIGQFDKNSPAMKLLGDNSDSSSDEKEEEEEEDEDEKRNLLQRLETSNTKRKAAEESTNTKATTSQKRPKGPLITELS